MPPSVAAVATAEDVAVGGLYPEEEALVARAVPKRRREFTTARHCARRALGKLGIPPVPIVTTDRGAPRWPSGIVGSMTHCHGYRAAAVARQRDVLTLGIDAEPNDQLPSGVLGAITVGSERRRFARLLDSRPELSCDRLLFSAKESVYKARYPLTGCWLEFTDAELDVDPVLGVFTARLLVPAPVVPGYGPLAEFTGRWAVGDGVVVTASRGPCRTEWAISAMTATRRPPQS
ncbi:4'-phosphopantetheinyl transferase superfamily protein [Streptomyces sp. NPDC004647]|uniref:4'-phosphopantetheinyl transferase family protein n=1 Tax=Streptomyces sp. NPDC004647 TaxID=3154671 RepID=UPI0033AD2D53